MAYLTNDIKNGVFDDERILHISDVYGETSNEYYKNYHFNEMILLTKVESVLNISLKHIF